MPAARRRQHRVGAFSSNPAGSSSNASTSERLADIGGSGHRLDRLDRMIVNLGFDYGFGGCLYGVDNGGEVDEDLGRAVYMISATADWLAATLS